MSPEDLLVEHIGRPENTSRAYAGDLRRFGAFIGADGNVEAVRRFVSMPRGQAVLTLRQYQRHLQARSESDYTVRRYIASLLGLLKLAHELYVIEWAIRYKLPPPPEGPAVRSRRVPTRPEILDMMSIARRREDAKGWRDHAMLHLLYFSALRRHEVLGLDVRHVDLSLREIRVKTKGRRQRLARPIAMETAAAVATWLTRRGEEDGPLFTSLDRGMAKAGSTERLSENRAVRRGALAGPAGRHGALQPPSVAALGGDAPGGAVQRQRDVRHRPDRPQRPENVPHLQRRAVQTDA